MVILNWVSNQTDAYCANGEKLNYCNTYGAIFILVIIVNATVHLRLFSRARSPPQRTVLSPMSFRSPVCRGPNADPIRGGMLS